MSDLVSNGREYDRQEKDKKKRERELTDIRAILLTPAGRRFYWRILERGSIFHDAFCNDNTNGTNYNLGRQSLSRDFLNDLMEAKPEALTQMQQERMSEKKDEERKEDMKRQNDGGLV